MSVVFRSGSLSLAIAIASGTPLLAQADINIDLSSTPQPVWLDTSYSENVILNGTASSQSGRIVSLYDAHYTADLINNATLYAEEVPGESNGLSSGALGISYSQIDGSLINKGEMIGKHNSASVLSLQMNDINNIVNQGLITQTDPQQDDPTSPYYETSETVYIGDNQIQRFDNQGTIATTGDNTHALTIENSHIKSFENSGTIKATGSNSVAMYVDQNSYIGDESLYYYDDPGIFNTGTILAEGENATALKVETFNDHRYTQIHNTGSIKSDGVAIDLGKANAIDFHQTEGLVEGKTALLGSSASASNNYEHGGSSATLYGGTIRGDIRNIYVLEVFGPVVIDSSYIQAKYLELDDGHLTLTQPHGKLDGNLELFSTLELTLSNKTNPNAPILNVTEHVELSSDASSRVLLTPKPNDFATKGAQNYKLISAQNWYKYELSNEGYFSRQEVPVDISDINVSSTSALLTVNSYAFEGNTLVANLETVQGEEAGQIVEEAGADANAQAALVAFTGVLPTLSADDDVFQAFANADAKQTARLAEQLAPNVTGAAARVAVESQRLLSDAIERRGQAIHRQPDNLSKNGFWVQALSGKASQDQRDGIKGFDLNASGIALGVDTLVTDNTLVGVAYGYLNSNVGGNDGYKLDADGHSLSLYGSYSDNGFFVDGNLTYGWNDNESKRHIAGTKAKGSYDSDWLGVNVLAGYTFNFSNNLALEPRIGARYTNVSLDGYREKGSSAALRVNSQRYESGELGAGVRLAGMLQLDKGVLVPEAKLMVWHDLIADNTDTTSTFVQGGSAFTTRGLTQARNTYEATLGLDYRLGAASFGISYNHAERSDFDSNMLQARMRYDF